MRSETLNRILIAGTGSGCGKTTVTCAILKALVDRDLKVQPYKCGPDYIDTAFHTKITGRNSSNLDTYIIESEIIKYIVNRNSAGADISVIEGVMGYYDGIGSGSQFSTYTLSKITDTPVVLIVNGKGMAASVAATVKGFVDFKSDNNIKAVIINGINKSYYNLQKEAIESNTGIEVIGYMPYMENVNFESRHLGLVMADEIDDFYSKLNFIAKYACECIDLDRFIQIANTSKPIYSFDFTKQKLGDFRLAIAKDRAFCFYYSDNLNMLKDLGADIVEFSPIDDKKLPYNIDGIYIGGGYPEIYAESLEKNISMRESIYKSINSGIPMLAECGGFMYLCNRINLLNGKSYNMVGALNGEVNMTKKLVRFGYVELQSLNDNLIGKQNWTIRAHEFHYSDSTVNGNDFKITKNSGVSWTGINATSNLCAGYPHINFWSNPDFAVRFCSKMIDNKNKQD